jgi:DNA-binding response OmpR family regulator
VIASEGSLPLFLFTPDRIGALRYGADDYIVKPYHPGEVVARVQAVLRPMAVTMITGTSFLRRRPARTSVPLSPGSITSSRIMGDTPDRIGALRYGADDYIVKPYHPGEVVARVQGGDHDHRNIIFATQASQDFGAVKPRKHHIQQDQIPKSWLACVAKMMFR